VALLAATTAALLSLVAAPAGAQNDACPPAPQPAPVGLNLGRVVSCPAELNAVLRSDYTGRVVVPAGVEWDMGPFRSQYDPIPLHSGVQLVGELGPLHTRPMLYTDDRSAEFPIFDTQGNDIRVEGIHFRGPEAGDRSPSLPAVTGIRVNERAGTLGRNVVIADNEFDQWTGAGVALAGEDANGNEPDHPKDWVGPYPTDANQVHIERNYFHHNAKENHGYGVVVGGGAIGTIEANVFDRNRHDVSSSGRAHSSYVARFNYSLQGGYTYGHGYYGQHYDVHGRDKSNDYDGGPAGEYFEIAYNTVRGDQSYYVTQTRPVFELRGLPAQGAYFHDNVVVASRDDAVALKGLGITAGDSDYRLHYSGNSYETDYSTEIATGDFDGDGRADVFLANGTAWWFSRAGYAPWELLHESDKRTGDLGFADIDNDGVTDVLYRDPTGKVGYLKGGRGALLPLTTSPVPMKDMRFGDFDGDGRTDIFYTLNGQWRIWYGRNHRWLDAQTSVTPVSELLFGEFDDVKGTDVAAVKNQGWSYSSAGTGTYTRFNGKLTDSFAGAVTADVDGTAKSDIIVPAGAGWRYSRDGRSPLLPLRGGGPLKQSYVGHFDGGAHDQIAGFSPDTYLWIWRRLPNGQGDRTQSEWPMR